MGSDTQSTYDEITRLIIHYGQGRIGERSRDDLIALLEDLAENLAAGAPWPHERE